MSFYMAIQMFLPKTFILQKIIFITSIVWSKIKTYSVVKADRDSTIAIMKKSDFVTTLDTMIDDGNI